MRRRSLRRSLSLTRRSVAEPVSTESTSERRGVYRTWWKVGARSSVYAVTSAGEKIAEVSVGPGGAREEDAFELLSQLLETVDPEQSQRAPLALVR